MQKGVSWLLAFAYDPKLRPRFFTGQDIEIRCVSPGREDIRLPRPKRWKEVARAALESQGETLRASDPKPGSSRHLKKNQSINAAVHCEVALALHFLSKDLEGPSPLPYIGISKPSCYACWGIFRCLQRSGAGLFIGRTNSNAPFPWKYPSTELDSSTYNAAKIYQEFYSIIAERYTLYILYSPERNGLKDRKALWDRIRIRKRLHLFWLRLNNSRRKFRLRSARKNGSR